MKRILILVILAIFLSGCAAWKNFIHPPKKCTTACDVYGNCEETCK